MRRSLALCAVLLSACEPAAPPDDVDPAGRESGRWHDGARGGLGGAPTVKQASRPWTERPARTLQVECRLIPGAALRSIDPTRPTSWRAGDGVAMFISEDEGRTWERRPFSGSIGYVAGGPTIFAAGSIAPYDVRAQDVRHAVSGDRGLTWTRPRFVPSRDAAHPLGTVVADLGGDVRLAWTPTRRLRYSTDGGRSWASEPDAYGPGGDELEWRSAIDQREWLGITAERAAWKTSDGGRSWQRVALPDRIRDPLLMGARGVVAVMTSEEGSPALWVSEDDGETWTVRDGFGRHFAVGPAEGEIWAMTFAGTGTAPRIMHSLDWGASFEELRPVAGAAGPVTIDAFTRRMMATPDGRRAGLRASHPAAIGALHCVESSGVGALELPVPARSTAPATSTFWGALGPPGFVRSVVGRQDWVPLGEPGQVFEPRRFSEPPGSVAYAYNGLTRTREGQVAFLVQPVEVLVPGGRFAMELRRYDPFTGAPGIFDRLDGPTDERGNALNLVSAYLHPAPDGTFLTDTALGALPFGGDPIRLSASGTGLPIGARWGRYDREGSQHGLAAVTSEEDGVHHTFALVRGANDAAPRCGGLPTPNSSCLEYRGRVRDWGMRDGRLYVLDDWRGTLWEGSFDAPEAPLRPVLTGLLDPSYLFVPTDEDPGIYVFDAYVYRVVPDLTGTRPAPRRP